MYGITGVKSGTPDKTFAVFKANEAFAKGDIAVMLASAADGYTVEEADAADEPVVGVATEAVAADKFGLFQTKGFNDYLITNDGVAAGELLISSATAGAADGVAIGSADAAEAALHFGWAYAADGGTTMTAGVMLKCNFA